MPSSCDVACLLHVHSTYSDGTATVPEIIAAARRAGANLVILTDHDTLGALHDGWEGWHDDVLLLVGHEVSPRGGHLLVLGVDRVVTHANRDERAILADVAGQGGLAIAAHPFSAGSRMSRRIGRPHAWDELRDPHLTGIELWSMTTDAAEGWATPRAALRELRAPERLDGPPARSLQRWDELCAERPVVAVGGLDAHQPGVRWRGRVRSIMPHERWFAMLRTHVILDDALHGDLAADRALVLAALRSGRCYLSLDHLGDPAGFAFWGERHDDRVPMGATARAGAWTLHAAAPTDCELHLRCNGERLAVEAARAARWPAAKAGAYRVEAWRRGRRWIVSNPIYLRSSDA